MASPACALTECPARARRRAESDSGARGPRDEMRLMWRPGADGELIACSPSVVQNVMGGGAVCVLLANKPRGSQSVPKERVAQATDHEAQQRSLL